MKWEETVMGVDKFLDIPNVGSCYDDAFPAIKAQAEITGDIAYKAGQRDIAEWIQTNFLDVDHPAWLDGSEFDILWQAKLGEIKG